MLLNAVLSGLLLGFGMGIPLVFLCPQGLASEE